MEEEPEGSSKGENTLPRARSTTRRMWVMCNWQERPSGTFPAGRGASLSFLPHMWLSAGGPMQRVSISTMCPPGAPSLVSLPQ